MRLTWKKDERETGLRAVCAAPRGAELRVDGVRVGGVSANQVGFHVWRGWYWTCPSSDGLGIAYRNTCDEPIEDLDAAKAACEAYVRECLKLPPKEKR